MDPQLQKLQERCDELTRKVDRLTQGFDLLTQSIVTLKGQISRTPTRGSLKKLLASTELTEPVNPCTKCDGMGRIMDSHGVHFCECREKWMKTLYEYEAAVYARGAPLRAKIAKVAFKPRKP